MSVKTHQISVFATVTPQGGIDQRKIVASLATREAQDAFPKVIAEIIQIAGIDQSVLEHRYQKQCHLGTGMAIKARP